MLRQRFVADRARRRRLIGAALACVFAASFGLTSRADATQGLTGCEGCRCSCGQDPSGTLGHPVNSFDGAFEFTTTDAEMPGVGLSFTFRRSYRSKRYPSSSPVGAGWIFPYGSTVSVAANGNAFVHSDTGETVIYKHQSDGSFARARGTTATLSEDGGGFSLRRRDLVTYRYNTGGHLVSISDRNGNTIRVEYDTARHLDRLIDTAGRLVDFDTDSTGHITRMRLPDGRAVEYAYRHGLLTSVRDLRGGTISYGYDAQRRLIGMTDQNGHQPFHNTYGPTGRVTSQVDALGHTMTFAFRPGSSGVPAQETYTDANGHAWRHVYTGIKLVKEIDPLGHATTYSYDRNYNRSLVIDANGHATRFTYDANSNPLTRTAPSPLSFTEHRSYDFRNNRIAATDGNGNSTSFAYDLAGNLIAVHAPEGATTLLERDSATGLVTRITNPNGRATAFSYDPQGDLISTTSPLGEVTTATYDTTGRLESVADPLGHTTTYQYDDADHLIATTDGAGSQTTFAYDAVGNLTRRTDANGHTTGYTYDAANRLVKVTAPDGGETSYGYDPVGNVVARTDANGHVTHYTYDAANRLIATRTPAGHEWTYGYDAVGNLTRTVTPAGNEAPNPAPETTTYAYDVLDRPTGIDYGDTTPDVTYHYDNDSNRVSMHDGAGTVDYAYDGVNRLTSVARGASTFGYRYDSASNLTGRVTPSGRTDDYAFDADNRLVTLVTPDGTITYGYDAASRLTTRTLPAANGYVEAYSYDAANRLTGLQNMNGANTLVSAQYTLDPVGNPLTRTSGGSTTTYAYDESDRLTAACLVPSCSAASDIRYSYDKVGNRLTERHGAATKTSTYDVNDQLLSTDGPGGAATTYEFNANGQEIRAGSRHFAYDLATRVISTDTGGSATQYSYDGDGLRLTTQTPTSTLRYSWDTNLALPDVGRLTSEGLSGPLLDGERNANGNLIRAYDYGGAGLEELSSSGAPFYYHHDRLGTILAVTGAAGAAQRHYAYEPFGATKAAVLDAASAPTNPMRFTGQYLDDTGLYYLRARQYDPATGRFLGFDPLPPSMTQPYGSTYAYTANRPTVLTDPTGKQVVETLTAIALALDAIVNCYNNLPESWKNAIADFPGEVIDTLGEGSRPRSPAEYHREWREPRDFEFDPQWPEYKPSDYMTWPPPSGDYAPDPPPAP